MGVKVTVSGSFDKTERWLRGLSRQEQYQGLAERFGPAGVEALRRATPKDSDATAEGWYYEVVQRKGYFAIHWYNSHVEDPGRIPVAVLLQYGHATRNGSWVQGTDYINPAMKPIFEQIAADMWKEVTKK